VWGECSLLVSTVWNSPTSYYIHRILISSENGDDKCRVKNGPQTYLSRISKIRSAPMNEISKSEWCKSLTEQLQDFHTLEPVSESQNCKSYSGGPGTQNFGLLWVTLGIFDGKSFAPLGFSRSCREVRAHDFGSLRIFHVKKRFCELGPKCKIRVVRKFCPNTTIIVAFETFRLSLISGPVPKF
jgi:hypothetical protein